MATISHKIMAVVIVVYILVLLGAIHWALLNIPVTRWKTPIVIVEESASDVGVRSIASDLPIYTREKTSLRIRNNLHDLPSEVINGIKKFVFFVGYERSGHSIVRSLMDAHPHVVIAHEFFLFKKFDKLEQVPNDYSWRDNLFQSLYSVSSRSRTRAGSAKGYTLKVKGLWEGTYDDHIEVIGDKSGGMTTRVHVPK